MMHYLRPYQILERLQEPDVTFRLATMSGRESRTLFLIETAILVAVARQFNIQSILEIGTNYGYTTFNLVRNTDARITTVDIEIPSRRVYRGEPEESRITELCQNSRDLSIRNYEMILIDGDHSREGVREDTKYAFQCSPQVIAWHDFENASEPDVKEYIDHISEAYELYHVKETSLVFWFKEGM